MNINTLLHYLDLYGYLIIFGFLFLGIIGIPAPEESLLFLIGILIYHHNLAFIPASLSAFFGAFIGMLSAYAIGKYIGSSFLLKYGKYVGITEERMEKVKNKYRKNVRKTILFGFYMPGIRQISPYFAGLSNFSFLQYLVYCTLGTILWTLPFILAGYYAGSTFHIDPKIVPYFGLFLFFLFLLYVFGSFLIKRKRQAKE
ncbi:DedA family protein [Mesobacillus subterraneus]|uniref:VTT domain-containing protein n=1 Tax=Mesobacillus subterraneus TaxID=285983 RepID=A0A0D6ZDB6_9BACI|nr:DedA family protein [Mesobacillus subterraneus]KIY23066.1 hypothetical protein UB32_04705 [Mesobacillus subterraneus]